MNRSETIDEVFEILRECLRKGVPAARVRVLERYCVLSTLLLDDASPSKRRRMLEKANAVIDEALNNAQKRN